MRTYAIVKDLRTRRAVDVDDSPDLLDLDTEVSDYVEFPSLGERSITFSMACDRITAP